MSSGPIATRLDFAVSDFGSQAPVGTARIKDQLIGNVLYCSDQSMYRTSINWMSCAASHTAAQAVWKYDQDNYQFPNALWCQMLQVSGLVIPVRDDGVMPKIAVHLYASISKSLTTNTFAVSVGSALTAFGPDSNDPATVIFDPTTSSSPAWLTPTSGSSRYLTMQSATDPGCVVQRTVIGSDGIAYATNCVEAPITVYCKTDNAEQGAIWGMHVHVFSV